MTSITDNSQLPDFSSGNGVDKLLGQTTINQLVLKNRIAMAPMTRSFSPGGIPGADVAAYYRRRAEGGVGLIITEGTWVQHPSAANEMNAPRFYGTDALQGWSEVLRQVHDAGARIIPQLWHVGLTAKPRIEQVFGSGPLAKEPTMGPSGIRFPGTQPEASPMTKTDIKEVVHAFAKAAESAKQLGFDGIEIHGAHGYLIDQFFWRATNLRTDEYGGPPANRARFGAEIVRACREKVGPDFLISFRFSQWKVIDFAARNVTTPAELGDLLAPLAEAGVDLLHCSTRRYWEPEFEGSNLNLAGWAKKLTGLPTMTVGSVGIGKELLESLANTDVAQAQGIGPLLDMLDREDFDLVSIGRALVADPEWPNKLRSGRNDFELFSSSLLTTLD